MSGKYGQNELANHRVKAYMDNLDDLYKALKETVIIYLKKKYLIDFVVPFHWKEIYSQSLLKTKSWEHLK